MSHSALIIFVLGLCLAHSGWASSTSSASQWLRATAAPEIADTLSRHPKFKGARIRIGPVERDRPSLASNDLIDRFRADLGHQILRRDSNDVVGETDPCRPHLAAPWYLAIRIEERGRNVDIRISMLDTHTGDWVGGISQRWRGTLSAEETRALRSVSSSTPAGHRTRPLRDLNDPTAAAALRQSLRCGDLKLAPTSIHRVADAEFDGWLTLTEHTLRERLPVEFVDKPEDAQWSLRASRQSIESDLDRIAVTLLNRTTGQVETLVQLYLVANERPRTAATHPEPPKQEDAQPPTTTREVSRRIYAHPKLSAERDPECRTCAAITLDLEADAHVLVFSTRHHQVFPLSCDQPITRREAGAYRFRINNVRNADAPSRPAAGVYVVASPNPAELRALASSIVSASARCGAATATLSSFLDEIDALSPSVVWDAIHIRRAGSRIDTLSKETI